MKKINLTIILSVILTVMSLFVKIVPCKKIDMVAACIPFSKGCGDNLVLCKLLSEQGLLKSYFGLSSNLIVGIILALIAWFIIWFLILSIFIKNKKKVKKK